MVRRGNLAVFEGSNISETSEVTPTQIDVYACHMVYTCMNFLNQFWSIKFFDDHGL